MGSDQPYLTQLASRVAETTPSLSWLMDQLFLSGGAGILGGAPKSCKSFLALEMAVAVASGTPVAGGFGVDRAGPALVLCAEDPIALVGDRLKALAASRARALDELPIHLIVEPGVRLPDGISRLTATVSRTQARLVVLDPLIRLHRADENSAVEMSDILNGLRHLARKSGAAVLVVHHARKAASGNSPGQGLRGSSDLHAFGDTNLYLRRVGRDGALELRIEHRATASPPPLPLRLRVEDGPAPLARFVLSDGPIHDPLRERTVSLLRTSSDPISAADLRRSLGIRNQALHQILHTLKAEGLVQRVGRAGWAIRHPIVPVPSPICGNVGTPRGSDVQSSVLPP